MSKWLYITLAFFLFSNKAFSIHKDSLNLDLISNRNVHRLAPDFKETYKGKDFVYEQDVLQSEPSWGERITRWLARLFQRIFSFDSTSSALTYVGYFFKFLYYLAIVLVIYLIAKTLLKREGRWIFGRKSDKLDISTETLEVDLLDTNFDALIKNAVRDNAYRLATRYSYLKTLKLLTKNAIIDWDPEKTNYDYLLEIESSELQKQFQYISYIYNYSWYGEFELDTNSYTEVERSFQSLFNSVG